MQNRFCLVICFEMIVLNDFKLACLFTLVITNSPYPHLHCLWVAYNEVITTGQIVRNSCRQRTVRILRSVSDSRPYKYLVHLDSSVQITNMYVV